MTKRIIALILTIVTLISVFALTVSAAYSTGSYTVTANSGLNVRSGAGTGYSKVGAAAKGTTFTVSKVSGSWGYTSSIKTTSGNKSGWVSLDYCSYKSSNSNRSTYNDVFASPKGKGYNLSQAKSSAASTFKKGDYVYIWGWLHDANGNLYKTYGGSSTCNMTLAIYRPNGTCKYSYTYNNCDNNWIGTTLDSAGTWKIQSKITGSLSGTNTVSITVKDTSTKTCTLSFNANGGSGAPSAQKVTAKTSFSISSTIPTRSGYMFAGWSTSKSASSPSYYPRQSVSLSGNCTLYAVWQSGSVKTSYTNALTNGKKYYISPACATGSVLDVDGGKKTAGSNLQIWQKADVTNQQFEARYYGSGYYYFVDVNSGLAIDVSGGIPQNGRNVTVYTINKTDAQLFRLISAGNGYYYIQSKLNPSYFIDVNGAYSSNGTNVQLYIGNSSSAQKFKFIAVPTPTTQTNKYASYTGINYTSILNNAKSAGKIGSKEYNNRVSLLKEAQNMATLLWTSPVSFHTWKSSSGSYNTNSSMIYSGSSTDKTMFVKGVTYKGIPYAANAGSNTYGVSSWLSLINKSGIKSSDLEATVNYLGYNRTNCTSKGIDCSGFVYQAYKASGCYKPGYLSTSGLLSSSYWKKINASSALPGDILLKSGHVMIYVGTTSSGKIAVLESTAASGFSGCRYYEHSSVSGYSYYRYTGIAN